MFGASALAVCGIAVVALAGAVGFADDLAWKRLAANVRAEGNCAYLGTRDIVVFSGARKLGGYQQKILRAKGGRERIVQLYPASQRGRLVVNDGEQKWSYWSGHGPVYHQPLQSWSVQLAEALRTLTSLQRTLRAVSVGDQTIAGRGCHVVLLKDASGKQVRRIWLDSATSVELKVQRFSSDGSLAYSSYFTAINFNPPLSSSSFRFVAPRGVAVHAIPPASVRMTLSDAQSKAHFRALLPGRVPPGYVLSDDQVAVSYHSEGQVALWLPYTNGIDTFSLFESRRPLEDYSPRAGAVAWMQGGYSFVLVGALTVAEVRAIKGSIGKR